MAVAQVGLRKSAAWGLTDRQALFARMGTCGAPSRNSKRGLVRLGISKAFPSGCVKAEPTGVSPLYG